MFKYYAEFRNGHCLSTKVEQLSPETESVTVLADFDKCQSGEVEMCAKYPNLDALKKRFPLEKSADGSSDANSPSGESATGSSSAR